VIKRKGIILAGGTGTRLYPATLAVSKQLLPVYDKPMIYYPLSTLMLAGVREILIISTPHDLPQYEKLLGTGEQWGLQLSYIEQPNPGGLAQAYLIGETFLGDDASVLILGDNLFYGPGLPRLLLSASQQPCGATICAMQVDDPERYGVIDFDERGQVQHIEEKPQKPKSNYAVTGIYFYDQQAVQLVKQLHPSSRGELEITDLNRLYLEQHQLNVVLMNDEQVWMDAGTHQSLFKASHFVQAVQQSRSIKIACLEEIAFRQGWISRAQLSELVNLQIKNDYGQYLMNLLNEAVVV